MKLFLSSEEYYDFEVPRELIRYFKKNIENRNVIIAEISNPLIGQKYGWGAEDITNLYLTNRFMEDQEAIEKLNKFPIHVQILIPKSNRNQSPSSLSELQNIAWACLYDNEEDARNHILI
ncbi:MAG TPA: hypothetical protein VET23_09490 [Chitinophagaceae bacterium]|nr:hypothetical protein [Chitinophagaceae bacterium]